MPGPPQGRLAIFPGSFDLAAADAVVGSGASVLDVLERLIDKSLVVVDRPTAGEAGDVRYRLLETIRAYGLERHAASGDERPLGAALLDHFARLVERAAAEFPGPDERRWIRRIALECDNLRAAMAVAIAGGDEDAALRLCGGLGQFWSVYGFLAESRVHVESVLARSPNRVDRARARAQYALGVLCRRLGDLDAAAAAFEASCGVAREAGERRQLALGLTARSAIEADPDAARSVLDEAEGLFPGPDEEDDRTRVAFARGLLAMRTGDDALARDQFARSLALFRRIGAPGGAMVALHNLGDTELRLEMIDSAEAHLGESLLLADELGERRVAADTLRLLGLLALRRGREAEGLARSRVAAEAYAADGYVYGVDAVLDGLESFGLRDELEADLRSRR